MIAHILIMDDERSSVEPLARRLSSDGYRVTIVETAAEAKDAILSGKIQVAIFDIAMKSEGQIALTKRARREANLDEYVEEEDQGLRMAAWTREHARNVGIAILTTSESLEHTIRGLDCGADIYVEKSKSLAEKSARITALVRRHAVKPEGIAMFGRYALNTNSRILTTPFGQAVLTENEFTLLRALIESPNKICSREELHEVVFGKPSSHGSRAIDTLVSKVRSKGGAISEAPDLISTIHGAGYKLASSVEWR